VKKYFLKKELFCSFFVLMVLSTFYFNCHAQAKDVSLISLSNGKRTSAYKEYIPYIKGNLESIAELIYRAEDENLFFSFPLYVDASLLYSWKSVEACFSVNYINTLETGEIYVNAKDENINIKIGQFIEDWGEGVALSTIYVFNPVDNRYPENIFFRRIRRPSPMLAFKVNKGEFFQQLVLCNYEANTELFNDTLLGMRSGVLTENKSITLGFVRKIGLPPLLSFLTVEAFGADESAWLELGWEYRENLKDIWSFVIGAEKNLLTSTIRGEFIVDKTNAFLFFEEIIGLKSSLKFDIRAFLHTTDFSSALNGRLIFQIDKGITLEPGFYLFLGKENKYFSPLRDENNSSVGIGLNAGF